MSVASASIATTDLGCRSSDLRRIPSLQPTTRRWAALWRRLDKSLRLGGIEGMVLSRHTPLVRILFAALIAATLMLNGMGRVLAATGNDDAGSTVVIAGTVVTLCQFGKPADGGDKIHTGHACDQCALRVVPLLPPPDNTRRLIRFPRILTLRPLLSKIPKARPGLSVVWPRGPPSA
jgi:hypothetical protein